MNKVAKALQWPGSPSINNDTIRVMNRKKKINSILKQKAKKANARLRIKNKPRYISKADRVKLAEQESDV